MNLYRKRHRDPFNATMPSLFSSDYSTSKDELQMILLSDVMTSV